MARKLRGPKSADGALRYGPSALWWGMALVLLAIVFVPPYLFFLLPMQPPSTEEVVLVWALWILMTSPLGIAFRRSWTRFTVRRDGLEQSTVMWRRFVAWEDMGRISTEEMGFEINEADSLGFGRHRFRLPVEAGSDRSGFYFVIRDADGAQAFRIPPWIAYRRHLITEIRHRIKTGGRR